MLGSFTLTILSLSFKSEWAMNITINEIRKIDQPGDSPGYLRVYLSVTASDGVRSVTEEFIIGRQVVGRAIVTNAQGWFKTATGTFVDPSTLDPSQPEPVWAYEIATQDFKAEILDVLKTTFDNMFSGRHRESRDLTVLKKQVSAEFGSNLNLPLAVRQLAGKTETI